MGKKSVCSVCNILFKNVDQRDNNINKKYTETEMYNVLYYLGLKEMINKDNITAFSIDGFIKMIKYYYKIDLNKNRQNHIGYIKLFLNLLYEYDLITVDDNVLDNLKCNDSFLLLFNPDVEVKLSYTLIAKNDVYKIANCDCKVNKIKLLNAFVYIASCTFIHRKDDLRFHGSKPKYGYPSYNNFVKDRIVKSKDTLSKYLELLDDLDLIRYKNCGLMKLKDTNRYITGTNHFVLYDDYSNFTDDDFNDLFGELLSAYKKAKLKDGWKVVKSNSRNK